MKISILIFIFIGIISCKENTAVLSSVSDPTCEEQTNGLIACMRQGIRDHLTCEQRVRGGADVNQIALRFNRICLSNNLKPNFKTECGTMGMNQAVDITNQLVQDTINDCGSAPQDLIERAIIN